MVRREGFPAGSFVLLADDFTNSGSTLFGGARIIRKHGCASKECFTDVSRRGVLMTAGAFLTGRDSQSAPTSPTL